MLWIGIWTAGVLLTGAAAIATAQTAPPKLIDVHEHFDGEPGVLQQMLIKLQAADDPSYWPIYDRAAKYHMILLFHTGIVLRRDPDQPENVSFDRMRATRLDLIARHWPKMIVIGAHLGNPDYAEAAEIARWSPNLYFDLSGSSLIKMSGDYGFFRSIFWWSGMVSPHTPPGGPDAFEKLVFGSDIFQGELGEFDAGQRRYHEMLDACRVPQNVQDMIFSGTMWRILQEQQQAAGLRR